MSSPGGPARLVSYEYVCCNELAKLLETDVSGIQEAATSLGWRLHEDRHGRPRVAMPKDVLEGLRVEMTSGEGLQMMA